MRYTMALSQYVLLAALSAGIPAHADTHGISMGPDVITQPNGGASAASTRVAFTLIELSKQGSHNNANPAMKWDKNPALKYGDGSRTSSSAKQPVTTPA